MLSDLTLVVILHVRSAAYRWAGLEKAIADCIKDLEDYRKNLESYEQQHQSVLKCFEDAEERANQLQVQNARGQQSMITGIRV